MTRLNSLMMRPLASILPAMMGPLLLNIRLRAKDVAPSSSAVRTKCQAWIDKNPDQKTQAEIKKGLVSVFNAFTDAELGKFSKHLSGDAFDVQPVSKNSEGH